MRPKAEQGELWNESAFLGDKIALGGCIMWIQRLVRWFWDLRNALWGRFLFLTGLVVVVSIVFVSVSFLAEFQRKYIERQLERAYISIKSLENVTGDLNRISANDEFFSRQMELYGIQFARLHGGGKSITFLDWQPSPAELVKVSIRSEQMNLLCFAGNALFALFSDFGEDKVVAQVSSEWSPEVGGPPPFNLGIESSGVADENGPSDHAELNLACSALHAISGAYSNFLKNIARVAGDETNSEQNGFIPGTNDLNEISPEISEASNVHLDTNASDRITIQFLLKKNREDLLSVAEPMLFRTLPFLLLAAAIVFFAVQKWIVSPVAELARDIERILTSRSDRQRAKGNEDLDAYEAIMRTEIREFLVLTKSIRKIFRATWIIKKKREKIIHDDFASLGQAINNKAHSLQTMVKKSIELSGQPIGELDGIDSQQASEIVNRADDLERNIVECVRSIFDRLRNVLNFINLQTDKLELERFGLMAELEREIESGQNYSRNIQAGERRQVDIRILVDNKLTQDEVICADRKLLRNAVGNLIKNAVKAIINRDFGNEIRVSVSCLDSEYICEIRDNGPGISGMESNFGKSVSEINFPRRPRHGRIDDSLSLGIGLDNAAQFAQRHGGDLCLVRTRENEGTLFRLTFRSLELD
ncbi:MAG: sensor histidine kinase [Albidovulum sp.]|nr:sensor histidine kinase [Albidovulum sp.]